MYQFIFENEAFIELLIVLKEASNDDDKKGPINLSDLINSPGKDG